MLKHADKILELGVRWLKDARDEEGQIVGGALFYCSDIRAKFSVGLHSECERPGSEFTVHFRFNGPVPQSSKTQINPKILKSGLFLSNPISFNLVIFDSHKQILSGQR